MLSPGGALRALVTVGEALHRLVVRLLGAFLWPVDRKLLTQRTQQQQSDSSEEEEVDRASMHSEGVWNAHAMPVGLVNKGNTCFISSILQCMRVCSGFWVQMDKDLMAIAKQKSGEQVEERFARQFQVALTLLRLMQNLVETYDVAEDYIYDDGASQSKRARRIELLVARHRDANSERSQSLLDALSECTPIISKVSSLQEQQDAEVTYKLLRMGLVLSANCTDQSMQEFLSLVLELLHEVLRLARPIARDEERAWGASQVAELKHWFRNEVIARKLNPPAFYIPIVSTCNALALMNAQHWRSS